MSDKIKKIYEALIGGAETGLSDKALFKHVLDKCPKASSRRIVKASLLALSDPGVKDANILHVIYALAIKHRLDPASADDIANIDAVEQPVEEMPQVKKRKSPKKQHDVQPAA